MKHRWLWVIGWFVALILWNMGSHWSQNADKNGTYIFLEAVGNTTSPIELLLSVVVVLGIVLSKRKPMAER
jgi:hypothetical protein